MKGLQKGSVLSDFITPANLTAIFALVGLFRIGYLEQLFLFQSVGILTALILLFLQARFLLWMMFVFILSFHYGELSFQPEKYSLWPENLKHFRLIFIVGGSFIVWTLLRPYLISLPLMTLLKKMNFTPLPTKGPQTLKSGQTWVEREFFSGKPNFKTLLSQPFPTVTEEEKTFFRNEIPKLCDTTSEWEIIKNKDIPQKTLKFIKEKKFLGMIIPKKYGGLEFSPAAHAMALQQVSSLNIPAAIFIMVPNSLGPSRLINRFGTQKQKEMWLPLLADGKEIPCFGLTEAQAGSDAGALTSEGVLFKGENGKLKIKINWNKRYISLASISTLLGVVFQLKDPENLLRHITE
ncbi:MAG: acyl-CoA dehydrogenase family protein, partial [Bdellovibrionales bacterium]|nr:acyl-CoA dehydrogenase family protein [Bdellovibrionales bacterium]